MERASGDGAFKLGFRGLQGVSCRWWEVGGEGWAWQEGHSEQRHGVCRNLQR